MKTQNAKALKTRRSILGGYILQNAPYLIKDSIIHEAVFYELSRRKLFNGYIHETIKADLFNYIHYLVQQAGYEGLEEQIKADTLKVLDDIATNPGLAEKWNNNFKNMLYLKYNQVTV